MRINKRLAASLSSVALFHVCSLLVVLPTTSAQQVDIIPFGSTWDYLFTSINDGTGPLLPADPYTANNVDFTPWSTVGFSTTTLTFNDGRSAPWESGPALFGYGDNIAYATPLPTPNGGDRDVTHYFRHEFTTTQGFSNLTWSVNVDDGVVVYLDGVPFSSMMSCCEDADNGRAIYDVSDPTDPRFATAPGYRDTSQSTNGPGGGEGAIYTEQSPFLVGLGTLPVGDHVVGLEVHQANGTSSDMRLDFRFFGTIMPPEVACDFNGDMLCDIADIDMLTAEIATGGNNLALDINNDSVISIADRDEWLSFSQAAGKNGLSDDYLLGDANLDGTVDAGDLNELGQRWQMNDNAWSHGDFTADGIVNASDLNELGQNWQKMVPLAAAAAVPEPSALSLLVIAALGLVGRRRRR